MHTAKGDERGLDSHSEIYARFLHLEKIACREVVSWLAMKGEVCSKMFER